MALTSIYEQGFKDIGQFKI